jgi:hypothetical protein
MKAVAANLGAAAKRSMGFHRPCSLGGCAWLLFASPWRLSAQATFPDPNAGLAPQLFGKVSSLIPMQSSEAVHMGLVWKRKSDQPKILFHSRFPEYRGVDMADPALTDLAIAKGGLTNSDRLNSRNNFNTSLRDVLHGFDPFLGLGMNRSADDSFQRLTYGGYLMRQGLSQSVPTRIRANRPMERQLLFNPFHPDAFKNFKTNPKFHTALLDAADFARNRADGLAQVVHDLGSGSEWSAHGYHRGH